MKDVINIENYSGPLDVLITLLEKNAMDIWDVRISVVIDQYLEYVKSLKTNDLDLLSRFAVMAATLISIKAGSILPKEDTDDEPDDTPGADPRLALEYQLIQYKMYKYIAGRLKDLNIDASKIMVREKHLPEGIESDCPEIDLAKLIEGKTLEDLKKAYEQLLEQKDDRTDPIRSKFGKIKKEKVTVEDYQIKLKSYLSRKKHFKFEEMLHDTNTGDEKIVAFLSLLELAKEGKIHISQEGDQSDIDITSISA